MVQIKVSNHKEDYDTVGAPQVSPMSEDHSQQAWVEVIMPPQAQQQPAAAKTEAVNPQPAVEEAQDPSPTVGEAIVQPEVQQQEPPIVDVVAEKTVVEEPPVVVDILRLLGNPSITLVRSTL